ncbi:MAG: anion permease [Lentisphaeria bacterium]|nr:anion permease [Lentisphaeria bacterium]
MLGVLGGVFLGWSLGANDAANCFGTAVSSRMLSWRRAAVLAALFVVLGALVQGHAGLNTLQGLTQQKGRAVGITVFAAALTVTAMTALKLPVSTSQAVVGALVGAGALAGDLDLSGLGKVVACWIGTPVGGMLIAAGLYRPLAAALRKSRVNPFLYDPLMRAGLVLCGCYGAYALGANNVANVSSFLLAAGVRNTTAALALGAAAIAAGILSFGRGVMLTVGRGITPLDAFSALIVVLAQAVTVHVYAMVGVPVSTSQAVVGSVLGIGLVKGVQIINLRVLRNIALGWVLTPLLAALAAVALLAVFAD